MTIRAEHIGSLQRPEALLAEVHRIYEAGHTSLLADERAKDLTRLRALEDEAIRGVVARQEDVGLEMVTDGEFRRLMYFNSFFDAVDGLSPSQGKLQFHGDDGSVVEHEGAATITGRVAKIDSPPRAKRRSSASSPSGRSRLPRTPREPRSTRRLARGARVVGFDDAIDAGATYVQFDVSGYMMLSGSPLGNLVRSRGIDLDALLDRMLEADRSIVAGMPAHVTTCLHQCRGNYASRYLTPHDHLGELGETFFSLPYDRFTLEWDGHVDRTDADYAALGRVPGGGATVVLGVVSTRHDRVESADEILATVERAARHIPVEQLAISPQCGFASALTTGDDDRPDGNPIDEDAQWRKLELLVTTARRIWT